MTVSVIPASPSPINRPAAHTYTLPVVRELSPHPADAPNDHTW